MNYRKVLIALGLTLLGAFFSLLVRISEDAERKRDPGPESER